jgi:hypothetical protein
MSSQLVAQVTIAAEVYLILISFILSALAIEKRQTEKGEEVIINNLT